MYDELTPGAQEEFTLEQFERTYEERAERRRRSIGGYRRRQRGRRLGAIGGQLHHPDLRQARRRAVRCRSRTARSRGARTWSSPGSPRASGSPASTRAPPRAPILARSTGARWPRARPPRAPSPPRRSRSSARCRHAEPRAGRRSSTRRGFPPGSLTGTSGLELALNDRLSGQAGRPAGRRRRRGGGVGRAAGRVLATSEPVPGEPVRTTIDPALQEAAVRGARRPLRRRRGPRRAQRVRARRSPGSAYSAPQPPGSTFKVITATGGARGGHGQARRRVPGRDLELRDRPRDLELPRRALRRHLRRDLRQLVQHGLRPARGRGRRREAGRDRRGASASTQPPTLFNAAGDRGASTPPASDDAHQARLVSVDVGESAIGQGQVLATPLGMASVAQTIANGGVRHADPDRQATPSCSPTPSRSRSPRRRPRRRVRDLMIGGRQLRAPASRRPCRRPGRRQDRHGRARARRRSQPGARARRPGRSRRRSDRRLVHRLRPGRASPKLAVAVMVVDAEGDGGEDRRADRAAGPRRARLGVE